MHYILINTKVRQTSTLQPCPGMQGNATELETWDVLTAHYIVTSCLNNVRNGSTHFCSKP